jgi:hypothetical protein
MALARCNKLDSAMTIFVVECVFFAKNAVLSDFCCDSKTDNRQLTWTNGAKIRQTMNQTYKI